LRDEAQPPDEGKICSDYVIAGICATPVLSGCEFYQETTAARGRIKGREAQ